MNDLRKTKKVHKLLLDTSHYLTASQIQDLHEYLDANEYGLAFEFLLDWLQECGGSSTRGQVIEVDSLGKAMGYDESLWRFLL